MSVEDLDHIGFFDNPPSSIRLNVEDLPHGESIRYLNLKRYGHDNLGLRIHSHQLGTINRNGASDTEQELLASYIARGLTKEGLVRTIISETMNHGFSMTTPGGIRVVTPSTLGIALVDSITGQSDWYNYQSLDRKRRLEVLTTVLNQQAIRMSKGESPVLATLVTHLEMSDGIKIDKLLNPIFDEYDLAAGLEALEGGSYLVHELRAQGLVCSDPQDNIPEYDKLSKTLVFHDIGSFGFYGEEVEKSTRVFLRKLIENFDPKKTTTHIKDKIYDSRIIFPANDVEEAKNMMRATLNLDEVSSRIDTISEFPQSIGGRDVKLLKRVWESVVANLANVNKGSNRLAIFRKLNELGGKDMIFTLFDMIPNCESEMKSLLVEMLGQIAKDPKGASLSHKSIIGEITARNNLVVALSRLNDIITSDEFRSYFN